MEPIPKHKQNMEDIEWRIILTLLLNFHQKDLSKKIYFLTYEEKTLTWLFEMHMTWYFGGWY